MKCRSLTVIALLLTAGLLLAGCGVTATTEPGVSEAGEANAEGYVEAVMNDARVTGLFEGTEAYNVAGEVISMPANPGDTCVVRVNYEVPGLRGEVTKSYFDFTVREDEDGGFTLFSPAINPEGRKLNF